MPYSFQIAALLEHWDVLGKFSSPMGCWFLNPGAPGRMVDVLQLGSILCSKDSGHYCGIATLGLGVQKQGKR